ncbi:hypothetical protein [Mesobacillus boroniphilus]|uniref:Uncharacterized protein n=1 Tax=Mesobacillus boroniphilus JCM 21738 TaxID=1294265 RepID=W4RHJ9_9BACI|nr:hypothetical protein [Mesobacillus boroniphilus]GAE43627.1 hypothetical protein JCM21738_278 [Mesobacillus boroniphilus JCM 21738]
MISNFVPEKPLQANELVESLKLLFYRTSGKEAEVQQGLQAFKQLTSMVSDGESLSVLMGEKDTWRQAGVDLLKVVGQPRSGNLTGLYAQLLSEAVAKAEHPALMQETDSALLTDTRIKQFLSALGLSYEQQLGEVLKDGEFGKAQVSETLKSLVLRLLNENPPPAVKEAAELILNKLTGFQLLSQEAGPIQQLVVQIPLCWVEKRMNSRCSGVGKRLKTEK